MDGMPESKNYPSKRKVYVEPELKQILLDDEEGLLEYCKGKPYDAQELKEVIKKKLNPKRGK
jgi:hypothetical protein